MNLNDLSDKHLRSDSKKLALLEKLSTHKLIYYIYEVDQRKLFCDWKYTSLFEWCVKELELCDGSAHLRITAARLIKDIPNLMESLENGELTLGSVSLVKQFCLEHKLKNIQVLMNEVRGLSKKDAEKKLFKMTGLKRKGVEKKKRISENEHEVTFILTDETVALIKEVKSLCGKFTSSDEVVREAFQSLKEKIEKKKFKQVKERRSSGIKVSGRIISSEVKRAVYIRDKKCVNCGSVHNLHYDHIRPHALGGDNSIKNIRLLCFNCNQRAAIKAGLSPPSF